MTYSVFISLVTYACATTFSPGPNNVLLLSCGARYGFKKCLPLLFGIWSGLLTVMLLCGFGCALLSGLLPSAAKYARFAGAAYILWLGYKTLLKSAPGDDKKDAPLRFINGFLLQFLNVKILMLGVAAYCSFVLPYEARLVTILIFAVTMAACAATGNLIWTGFGTLLLPVYRKHYRICNLVMALLLFWCVYKILNI
jgi:cysteine/O-acetylserine efflux protein